MSSQRGPKNNLIYLGVLVTIAAIFYVYFRKTEEVYIGITSFEACVMAGYPVLPTYPEQCKIPGKIFTNLSQVKEVSVPPQPATSTRSYVDLEYLIDGVPVTLGTSSAQLVPTNLSRAIDVNNDSLIDVVFVASKYTESNKPDYYVLLALGLHNGELAAANGLSVGKAKPDNIYVRKSGVIEVTHMCMEGVVCSHRFVIRNGILEATQ